MLGEITLTAAFTAAVARKNDAAKAWMSEAIALAERVPDDPVNKVGPPRVCWRLDQEGRSSHVKEAPYPAELRRRAVAKSHNGDWGWAAARAAAEVARLEPHVTGGEAMQVLGMLCLNASLVSAAGLDADSARSWLSRAADLARHVPDDLDNWQSFSAMNVGVWRVKVEVELGESGGKVLELARKVDEVRLASHPARNVHFLGEVGRGLARDRRTQEEAVRWLRGAEAVGPQRIRNHGPVRESVAVMLEQARAAAIGRELRGMAARMGIPH